MKLNYLLKTSGLWMILNVLVVNVYSQHTQSPEEALITYKQELERAVNQGEKELLMELKVKFEDLIHTKKEKKLALYYAAYTNYRLSSLFSDMDEDQQQKYLNTSLRQLERLTETYPEFAEGWALLSNCYGMKATGMISGMRYGPKSEKAIKEALKLSPDNPRVRMINGIGLMHKPAIFGGSNEKAIQEFREAAKRFMQWNPPNNLYPDWGYAETYAWLAQVYLQEDNKQKAVEAYNKSLQVNPDYYWVKEILLPELKQQMK